MPSGLVLSYTATELAHRCGHAVWIFKRLRKSVSAGTYSNGGRGTGEMINLPLFSKLTKQSSNRRSVPRISEAAPPMNTR